MWTAINPNGQGASPGPSKRHRDGEDGSPVSPSSPKKKRSKRSLMETEEALEARLTALYEKTLRSHDKPQIAASMYNEILDAITSLEDDTLTTTTRKIQYLCLKNLAQLEAKCELSDAKNALLHFAEALKLDASDCIVWYEAGCVALELNEYSLARAYFESAFGIDPCFWPLVDKFVQVLYILSDEAECLRLVDHILSHDPGHPTALYLQLKLQNKPTDEVEIPKSIAYLEHCREIRDNIPRKSIAISKPVKYALPENTWHSLAHLLLDLFEQTQSIVVDNSFDTKLPFSQQRIVILPATETSPKVEMPDTTIKESERTKRPSIDSEVDDVVLIRPAIERLRQTTESNPSSPTVANRRTSHRTQKRMQDEIEAAIREAKENDISYQLLSFIKKEGESEDILKNTMYDCSERVEPSKDCSQLCFFKADNEESSGTIKLIAPSPISTPRRFKEEQTNLLCIELSDFLQNVWLAKGYTILELMIQFVDVCTRIPGTLLDDQLVELLLWIDKCVNNSLSASMQHVSSAMVKPSTGTKFPPLHARLFILEIQVDRIITKYDPLQHNRNDYITLLKAKLKEVLQIHFDATITGATTLSCRLQWLMLHINEQLGLIDQVVDTLDELLRTMDDTIITIANVKSFPILSKVSVKKMLEKFSFAMKIKEARRLYAKTVQGSKLVEEKILDLLLPHYDVAKEKGGHLEDLMFDLRVYFVSDHCLKTIYSIQNQLSDLKTAGHSSANDQLETPILIILVKCLRHCQKMDICYDILVLCWYFILSPTRFKVIADKATIQCLKYVTTELKALNSETRQSSKELTTLTRICCFQTRDFLLQHFHSSTLLCTVGALLPVSDVPALVGKIVRQITLINLRKRSKFTILNLALAGLQLLYQHLKTMGDDKAIDPTLARALCESIAMYLKDQLSVGKFKAQSRHLLYGACTSFLLLWQHLGDDKDAEDALSMIELLHELLTTGDGLEDRGMCCLDNDLTFLLTTQQILSKIDTKPLGAEFLEDLQAARAQSYCCMYGYALLSSCVEHRRATRKASSSELMDMLSFSITLDQKRVCRKECFALYKSILEQPGTESLIHANVQVSEELSQYINPTLPTEVHTIKIVASESLHGIPEDKYRAHHDLYYLLARNLIFPKHKRRGKEYQVLLDYEQRCVEYIMYLRKDITINPRRADSYYRIAKCIMTLRALIVDQWNVIWTNHFIREYQPHPHETLQGWEFKDTFDVIAKNHFFASVISWMSAADKYDLSDTDSMSDLYDQSEATVKTYSMIIECYTELALRCLDMAATLNSNIAVECYEDSSHILWNIAKETRWSTAPVVKKGLDYISSAMEKTTEDDPEWMRLSFMCGKLSRKLAKVSNSSYESALQMFQQAHKYDDEESSESLPHGFYQLHATRLKLLLHLILRAPKNDLDDPERRHDPIVLGENIDAYYPSNELMNMVEKYSYSTREEKPQSVNEFEHNTTMRREKFKMLVDNCIDALECIPLQDKYFHPAYYALARGIYYAGFLLQGERYGAIAALKWMKPLFDKKRSQVVAVWLSESPMNKLEELSQQQAKYDCLRIKYHSFYMHLLVEVGDYARVCEITSWVLSSKEDHWVMDAMLAHGLVARSHLARGRVLDMYFKCLFQENIDEPPAVKAMSHLHRMYGVYMETQEAWPRARYHNQPVWPRIMSNMGNWVWELAMSYALAQALKADATTDPLCVQIVLYVKGKMGQRDLSSVNEMTWIGMPVELDVEKRHDWSTLVKNALAFCSSMWPEKTKPKSKQPNKPKIRMRWPPHKTFDMLSDEMS
ncbi:exonuclease 1 [Thraustotheca clavata]|uniref:Exonuclease 1 n=1 Tax=Thraustotheca clavata TaxID=74557 RepID=A0A1V9ZCF7_9STRA|nr:exonuclease 1 [Thraustotheca clavata]